MIDYIKELFSPRLFGVVRSNKWPFVRSQHLKDFPNCAVCSTDSKLAVHHIVPVHIDFTKELDPTNLITLCEPHHLLFGHLNSWYSYNTDVLVNAQLWAIRIKTRP